MWKKIERRKIKLSEFCLTIKSFLITEVDDMMYTEVDDMMYTEVDDMMYNCTNVQLSSGR